MTRLPRDPTPALQPPKRELPGTEWAWCGIVLVIVVLGVAWAVTH